MRFSFLIPRSNGWLQDLKKKWGKYPEILHNWFICGVMVLHMCSTVWLKVSKIKLRKDSQSQKADVFYVYWEDAFPLKFSISQDHSILFKSVEFTSSLHFGQENMVTIKPEQHFPVLYLSCTFLIKVECFYICAQLYMRRNWKLNTVLQR